MTASDWQHSTDVEAMLRFLGDQLSGRKRRLFACACCRLLWWNYLEEASCRNAVEVAEQYADGLVGRELLAAAAAGARAALGIAAERQVRSADPYRPPSHYPGKVRTTYGIVGRLLGFFERSEITGSAAAAAHFRDAAAAALGCTADLPWVPPNRFAADLLRDIVDPFQPADLPAAWPAEVTALASATTPARTAVGTCWQCSTPPATPRSPAISAAAGIPRAAGWWTGFSASSRGQTAASGEVPRPAKPK